MLRAVQHYVDQPAVSLGNRRTTFRGAEREPRKIIEFCVQIRKLKVQRVREREEQFAQAEENLRRLTPERLGCRRYRMQLSNCRKNEGPVPGDE